MMEREAIQPEPDAQLVWGKGLRRSRGGRGAKKNTHKNSASPTQKEEVVADVHL